MAIATPTVTRLQDQHDAPVLGAGQNGYALTWNNAMGAFVATALVTAHSGLTGLTTGDDHTQYALLAGRAGGQTLYGGDAANDDITIHGTSNATRTTSYVLLQPTAGNVGIGTTAPDTMLHLNSATGAAVIRMERNSAAISALDIYGSIEFEGQDASYQANGVRARIAAIAAGTGGETDLVFGTATGGQLTQSEKVRVTNAGYFGVGTPTPASLLEIQGGLTTEGAILSLGTKETTVIAGDVLGRINFHAPLETDGGDANLVAASIVASATAAFNASLNATSLLFQTGYSEVATTKMQLDSVGNLKLGGSAVHGTTVGTNHIDIFDGTAPAGTLANGISIYSTAGECYIMDAAGNATLQSPHDPETNEWIFYSENTVTGRKVRVNMEQMVAAIEAVTGQQFMEVTEGDRS